MTLSAAFTVEAAANPDDHTVAYGATVDLAITSLAYNTITWSIAGTSKSNQSAPTITLAGTPNGSTASFPMPSDPGDGLGRSFRVKCLVTDSQGNSATQYAIVGAVNSAGLLPVPVGEEVGERDATHGWTDVINAGLTGAVSGGTSQSTANRVWEVGQASNQYATVNLALTAIASASPALSTNNRGSLLIYPGKYTSTAAYSIPAYLSVGGVPGGRGTVQLQNSTTNMFTVAGGNNWFHDFLVEGSATAGLYAFDCNNQSAIHIERVDMLDAGGTARQSFLTQSGATWTILKIEDCVVDYNGLTAYCCSIYNTSGAARIVDVWVKDSFFDAFALTSGGGSFDLSKLRDIRFWRCTIRGTNDPGSATFYNTGIRVRNGSSTGITCEIAHCLMTGAERGSGGVGTFGDANTTIFLDNSVCRGAASSGTLTTNNSLITA